MTEKKPARLNRGLLTAIPCLAASCLCLIASRTYPNLTADYMAVSAAFFPTIVSAIMVAVSLIMLLFAFIKPDIVEISDATKRAYIRGLLAILICVIYVAIFKPVGYIVSSVLAVFAMMLVFGNRKWKQMIIISVVFPVLLYLAFYYGLSTNLPSGVLGLIAELF